MEAVIAEVWAGVLQEPNLSVLDNLFDVGGHSLTILQIHHKLTEKLGRRFPMVKLFEQPTVAGLAAYLEQLDNKDETPDFESDDLSDNLDTSSESVSLEEERRSAAAARRRAVAQDEDDDMDADWLD